MKVHTERISEKIKIISLMKNSYGTREIARKELKDLLDKKFLREEQRSNQLIYFVESKYLKESVLNLLLKK